MNTICLFIYFLKISDEEKLDLTNPKIQEEKREIGSIEATVYWQYIKAGGNTFLSSLLRQLNYCLIFLLTLQSWSHFDDFDCFVNTYFAIYFPRI